MSLHSTALQTAIYTLLSGDSTLDGLVGNNRIYDEVYRICISLCCYRRRDYIDASTKDKDAQEFTQTIHIWSRYRGSKQKKKLPNESILYCIMLL